MKFKSLQKLFLLYHLNKKCNKFNCKKNCLTIYLVLSFYAHMCLYLCTNITSYNWNAGLCSLLFNYDYELHSNRPHDRVPHFRRVSSRTVYGTCFQAILNCRRINSSKYFYFEWSWYIFKTAKCVCLNVFNDKFRWIYR